MKQGIKYLKFLSKRGGVDIKFCREDDGGRARFSLGILEDWLGPRFLLPCPSPPRHLSAVSLAACSLRAAHRKHPKRATTVVRERVMCREGWS